MNRPHARNLAIVLLCVGALAILSTTDAHAAAPPRACVHLGYTEGGSAGTYFRISPTWRGLVFVNRANATNHIHVGARALTLTHDGQSRRLELPRRYAAYQLRIGADHSFTEVFRC